MKKYSFLAFALMFIFNIESTKSEPLKIILKLDDLIALNGQCSAKTAMDYLVSEQVKFSIGVIANRIDATSYKTLSPYINAVDSNGDNLVEFWHHGYDHVLPEFNDRSYEYQKQHFEDANKRVKDLLNIQMHTFGAPGNATDSITAIVLSENPLYHVFLLGNAYPQKYDNIQHWMQRVEMENGTGNVNYDYFLANYNKYKKIYKDYMIFQGHPNVWDENKLDEFKKIIDFLKNDGCEFVLPYDYFCQSKLKSPIILIGNYDTNNKNLQLKWIDTNKIITDYIIKYSIDSIQWKTLDIVLSNKKIFNQMLSDTITYENSAPLTNTEVFYKVKVNNGNNSNFSNVVKINVISKVFDKTVLNNLKIYPNPCKLKTNIEYEVLNDGLVEGAIYNLNGEKIMSIFKEIQNPGFIKKEIDVSNFMSGLYLFKLLQPKGIIYSNKILIEN